MKSRFLIELERKQNIYTIGKNKTESFYYNNMEIPIVIDEQSYLALRKDKDFRIKTKCISMKLGLTLSLSVIKMCMIIRFKGKGFFCYKAFYGILRKSIRERLDFEYGGVITFSEGRDTMYLKFRQEQISNVYKDIEKSLAEEFD